MDGQRIAELARKWANGTITPAEKAEFDAWYHQPGNRETIDVPEAFGDNEEALQENLLARIHEKIAERELAETALPVSTRVVWLKRAWVRWAVAAILVLSAGAYLWNTQNQKETSSLVVTNPDPLKNDVAPGSRKAVLVLSDGRHIALDSSRTGLLTEESSAQLSRNAQGEIVYTTLSLPKEMLYNTLTVPRGSQVVNVTLSDGTKVWLNAESTLRYPVAFINNHRRVELTGEAYFEVTKDANKPFHVKAGDHDIEVLGTAFNVNAYGDEVGVKTSLIEGSVKVTAKTSRMLKPGEAYLNGKVFHTNIEQDVAWKNGTFFLNGADIQTILRQAARWYDVEFVYEGQVPQEQYMGDVSRQKNISELLNILEQTGTVHFKINGRKITVTP